MPYFRASTSILLIIKYLKPHRGAHSCLDFIIGSIIAIAAILIYVATRPNAFRIERSTRINASPAAIYAQLNNFHTWEAWSPWEKLDPAVKRTYGGADADVGAKYAWVGNRELGAGNMKIITFTPNTWLIITIEFLVPFKAVNTIEFTLTEKRNATMCVKPCTSPVPLFQN